MDGSTNCSPPAPPASHESTAPARGHCGAGVAAQVLILLLALGSPRLAAPQNLTAVWANDGGDKVARQELRASGNPAAVRNSLWDGTTVRLFGARNETVAFQLVLEAAAATARQVAVRFDRLSGPTTIASRPTTGDGVFDWTGRPIELFYVRYLEIRGLSVLSYEHYDERHVPERFRRPWTGDGEAVAGTTWSDRPDANRHYPEIAVPLELVGRFDVARGESQTIWVDVFVPRTAPSGVYQGTVTVGQGGAVSHQIPVVLSVRDFTLPDRPSAQTMLVVGYADLNRRYLGQEYPDCGSPEAELSERLRDRHFLLAHRHRISLVDDNDGACYWDRDRPRPQWLPRLDGTLYTAAHGYDGPGVGIPDRVFSIGTYGSWEWQGEGRAAMWAHTDGWEGWFQANAPATERFLYLIDESDDYPQIEQWARWIATNPGVGSALLAMATIDAPTARTQTPSLDVVASGAGIGLTARWQAAADYYLGAADKRFYLYNGWRPATGTFVTEDDGVALRALAWAQYKKKIDRWFYWESTYYDDFQSGAGQTNVFREARTFGGKDEFDPVLGETGWNYNNGDGVLFYPGTDRLFPQDSYGVMGPLASLRMKLWRRGLQDVDYLVLAAAIAPGRVPALVGEMVPRVLWEYGVEDPDDPTWVLADVSWSTDPDDWERVRCELAEIIDPGGPECSPTVEPEPCTASDTELCLNAERFRVTVTWRDFQGRTGSGRVAPAGAADSGLFWFFDAENWELLVKVLDGCAVNDRYWVFAAATTNVEYTLRVVDTATGAGKSYTNPLGVAAAAITDTAAFAACRQILTNSTRISASSRLRSSLKTRTVGASRLRRP